MLSRPPLLPALIGVPFLYGPASFSSQSLQQHGAGLVTRYPGNSIHERKRNMEIGEEKDEKRAHAHEYTLHSTLPSPAIIGLLRRRPAASYAYTHIFMQDAGKHSTASLYKTYKQDYTAPREERSNFFLLTISSSFPLLFSY